MTIWLILAVIIGAGLYFVRKSGSDAAKVDVMQDNEKANVRVVSAISNSPANHDDLATRLQSPDGKL